MRSWTPHLRRNNTLPPAIRLPRSTIRRIARAATLLPHPLSPTMPMVRPGMTWKLTPSTAHTQAQKAEAGVTPDHCRQGQSGGGDDVTDTRRQHVNEHNAPRARAAKLCGQHEILVAQRHDATA